jgi:O-antigen biosynthesis protein WbqP
MIRFFDIIFSILGLIFLFPLLLLILFICIIDVKKPLFLQERLGYKRKIFKIYKFRTMKLDTLSVATHLVDPRSITFIGYYLRKSKLDELPQLLNILKGDMSFVGPRPCLLNQIELINLRNEYNIFDVRPGITGLAQISTVDMSQQILLTKLDFYMINNTSIFHYFYYIIFTILNFKKF